MKAIWDVAKATAAAVVAVKVAENTEAIIAKGGSLAGRALAAGKRRLREARAERKAKRPHKIGAFIFAALVLASPLSAQTPLSDAQLRQRVNDAIARAGNAIEEVDSLISRLETLRTELTRRINATTQPPAPPPAPSGPTVYFRSDWSTATGSSLQAVYDQGKSRPWTGTYISVPEVRSTAADGLDFPTVNYLRVPDRASGVNFDGTDGYYPAPGIGERRCLRFYVRNTQTGVPTGFGSNSHGIYFDDSWNNPNWGPQVAGFYVPGVQGADLLWRLSAGSEIGVRRYWRADTRDTLVRGVTYRVEFCVTVLTRTTYTLEARIYDVAGNLLDGTWLGDPGWPNINAPLAAEVFAKADGNFASLTGLRVTLEDAQGGTGGYMAVAAVAVCNSWCGPYSATAG